MLPATKVGQLHEALPCRLEHQRQARGLVMGQLRRLARKVLRIHHTALGVAAGWPMVGRAEDRIAHRKPRHPFADRGDHSAQVEPEDVWQLVANEQPVVALPHFVVDWIHRRRVYVDQTLAGPRARVGYLLDLKHIGRPVLVHKRGFHRVTVYSLWPAHPRVRSPSGKRGFRSIVGALRRDPFDE